MSLPQESVNFSAGNPAFCFSAAARYALSVPEHDLTLYHTNNYLEDFLASGLILNKRTNLSRGLGPSRDLDVALSNGTAHAFLHVLRSLKDDFQFFKKNMGESYLKPAIIFPTPTYGVFYDVARKEGFSPLIIKRKQKDGWRLDAGELSNFLKETMEDLENNDILPIAFFDSNPNNPTGLVRGKNETEALASVFHEHNQGVKKRWKEHFRYGYIGVPRISIIDDMVYCGLEYDESKKPVSFLTDKRIAVDTYLLLGTSKIGLPAMRGGMIVCNCGAAEQINANISDECSHPNLIALRGMAYTFSSGKKEICAREDHLRALRASHMYGETLVRAMIQGLPPDEIDSTQSGNRLLKDVVANLKDERAARDFLSKGTPELELLTRPEAGFFHLAQLRQDVKAFTPSGCPVSSDSELETLMENAGVTILPGSCAKLETNEKTMRLSCALPPQDIVEGFVRIRRAFAQAQQGPA